MPEPDYTRIHNAISEEILQLRAKRRAQEILLLRTERRAQEILLLPTERRAQGILLLPTERRAQGTCHPARSRRISPGLHNRRYEDTRGDSATPLRSAQNDSQGIPREAFQGGIPRDTQTTPSHSPLRHSTGHPINPISLPPPPPFNWTPNQPHLTPPSAIQLDTQSTPSHSPPLRHSTGHPINPISLPPPGGVKIATRFWWGERIGIPRNPRVTHTAAGGSLLDSHGSGP